MKLFKLLEAKYGKDIDLSHQSLSSLPNDLPLKVEGYFDCSNNQLQSLQYCPTFVEGNFFCSHNQLQSLQYCPTSVGGNFYCYNNQLKSLQYCPTFVEGNFDCYNNQLTTLKYLPKEIGGNIFLSGNPDCYEELWMLCKTKLSGNLYINDSEELEELFNSKYKNVGQGREMLRFQSDLIDMLDLS